MNQPVYLTSYKPIQFSFTQANASKPKKTHKKVFKANGHYQTGCKLDQQRYAVMSFLARHYQNVIFYNFFLDRNISFWREDEIKQQKQIKSFIREVVPLRKVGIVFRGF